MFRPPHTRRQNGRHRFVRRPTRHPREDRGTVWASIVSGPTRTDACVSVSVRETWCGPARTHTTPRPRHHTPRTRHGVVPRAPCPMPSRAPPSAHLSAQRPPQRPPMLLRACDGPNGPSTGHRAPSQAVGGATPYTWMMAAIASVERASAVSGPYQPRPTGTEQSPSPREAARSEYGVMVATWACRSHLMGEALKGHQWSSEGQQPAGRI